MNKLNQSPKLCPLRILRSSIPRGFNGSVNVPESCDFRSQFHPLNMENIKKIRKVNDC